MYPEEPVWTNIWNQEMEGSFSSKLVARPQGISKKKALCRSMLNHVLQSYAT